MKKQLFALAAIWLGTSPAHADSVTIYGLLDAGITHYSNVAVAGGGSSSINKMDTGVANGSRLGFRGSEDLGGGMTAFFTLENGLNIDDGSAGQGGALFGRQAFVGVGNAWGNLSLGRQYDFMINQNAYSTGAATVAGLVAFGLHAYSQGAGALNDRIYAGDRVNNSVKYTSKPLAGFTFGALYGFGEVAGNSDANRVYSARIGYDNGPASAGLAMTDVKDALGVTSKRMYGLGGSYVLGSVRPFALLTHVKNSAGARATASNYELGASWQVAPVVNLAAGYQKQTRNNDVRGADQLTLVADYQFSKRTNVYLVGAYVRDKGFNAQAVAGVGLPSTEGKQTVLRTGLRHMF